MREIPILMCRESVQGIRDNRKRQTRRLVTERHLARYQKRLGDVTGPDDLEELHVLWDEYALAPDDTLTLGAVDLKRTLWALCPVGEPGDHLWVRETWAQVWKQEGCLLDGDPSCPCSGCHLEYQADTDDRYPAQWPEDAGDDPDCPKWRPSIHMFKWATRLWLENTGVRIQRVQDITIEDCLAEGLPDTYAPKRDYHEWWDRLNAKRGFPYADNPRVWVLDFEVPK